MGVEPGDRVRVDYIATLPNGAVFDTSIREVAEEHGLVGQDDPREFEPLEFVVGEEGPFAALAEGLVGMEEGEVDTAYAEISDDLVAEYDRAEFRETLGQEPEEGMHIEAEDGTPGTVASVDGDTVLVDFTPELPGEEIELKLRIVGID